MRLFVGLIGTFLVVCALIGTAFFWIGQRAPVQFRTEVATDIEATPDIVWAALTNIGTLTDRDDKITEVELLVVDDHGPLRWKVLRGDTSVMIYKRLVSEPNRRFEIAIDGGNMAIVGGYEYRLTPLSTSQTRLIAVEETEIEDILFRAAFALAGGRDRVLRAQLAEIKQVSEDYAAETGTL